MVAVLALEVGPMTVGEPRPYMPPDFHVHTEWSWDAQHGSMEESCRQAVALGLTAIAFTDHADFTEYVKGRDGLLDIEGYLDCVERCRTAFPDLRILSGVELGEPHRFVAEAEAILGVGPLDRILGSVHCLLVGNELVDASSKGLFSAERAVDLMRSYLAETLSLIESSQRFDVLAHLDYPKRYWPHGELPYREVEFEEEYRAVLVAAARRDLVLEVNTTRGADHRRGLCPGPTVLRWWREVGGRAVSLGSDAHSPGKIAAGFPDAGAMIEAAGFRPAKDPSDFWRR